MAEPTRLEKLLSTKGNLNNSYSNSNSLDSLESSNSNNIAISYKLYDLRSTKVDRKFIDESKAKQKAAYIESKLHNPQGRLFYLKCAWNLTEQFIDDLLERSLKKKCPARYFCSAASREMKNNE